MSGDAIENFEDCSKILKHEYFFSNKFDKPSAYE